jgi:hypothetical protein
MARSQADHLARAAATLLTSGGERPPALNRYYLGGAAPEPVASPRA